LYGDDEMAETEGFEPSIPFSRYAHLANECLQPLGHISCNTTICPTRWRVASRHFEGRRRFDIGRQS
jgi:hypothetical protein